MQSLTNTIIAGFKFDVEGLKQLNAKVITIAEIYDIVIATRI